MVRGKKKLSCETLGSRLRRARQERNLSARALSLLAGLSGNTVQMVEDGKRLPGVDTAERLATALGVSKNWLTFGEGPESRDEVIYWIAPGFDGLKMVEELHTLVSGPGGHIEQSYKYLDPSDALAWRSLLRQPRYASIVEGMPIHDIADYVLENAVGRTGLDLVGLGVGTARQEARLVSRLLDREYTDLRLFLLDISQPLLNDACKTAHEMLAGYPAVRLYAINGNFHHLQSYERIFQTTHRRQRLLTMFGYTFGNLDNEIGFMRSSLSGMAPGDLLLLDVPLAHAPAEDDAEIERKDPALVSRNQPEFMRQLAKQAEFNVGPLRRYYGEASQIDLGVSLDKHSCVIPGSYAIHLFATLRTRGSEQKNFSLAYIKRYDPERLAAQLRTEGWELVEFWRYGGNYNVLGLFRRLSATDPKKMDSHSG
jgi:transcriptional regulator with XRE-family HTH domain